jgi:hypothetical protein
MTKIRLLGGVAAGILLAAGGIGSQAAFAQSASLAISYGASVNAGDISTSSNLEGGVYHVASESKTVAAPGDTGTENNNNLDTLLNYAGSLPSSSVELSITLNGNMVFGTGGITAADITDSGCSTFTVTPSSGGAAGSNTATFVISNSTTCTTPISVVVPVTLTSAAQGNSGVTYSLLDGATGLGIDGGIVSANLIDVTPAFSVAVVADTLPTVIATGTAPYYTTFLTGAGYDTVIGSINSTADTNSHRDLTPADLVVATDVQTTSVAVTGAGLTTDYATFGPPLTFTPTTGETTCASTTYTGSLSTGVAATSVSLNPCSASVSILPSTYSASATLNLLTTEYTAGESATGALQTVSRQGYSVLVPWTASGTLSGTSGFSSTVRVSNQTNVAMAATVEVIESNKDATLKGRVFTLPPVPANSSISYTSAALQTAIGEDFGQADLLFTIAGSSQGSTFKRLFVRSSDSSVTEMSVGEAIEEQGQSSIIFPQ